MKHSKLPFILLTIIHLSHATCPAAPVPERARLIVLADMGNEPDEEQQMMQFAAAGSSDPDGNALRYAWWNYPEAGRKPYGRSLEINNSTAPEISITIPADAVGKELHLILEVWDDSPIVPLVDYRRAVISVPQTPEP